MPNFFPFGMPYWNFPYYKNNYYSRYKKNANNVVNNESRNQSVNFESNDGYKKTKNSTTSVNSSSTVNNTRNLDNKEFINLLGIDLYFDDILIFCILFSLYSEGVKDEMLFICLILLLLS